MIPKRKDNYFVYIVQCVDGTYYTGYTNNLEKRIERHNSGHGSKYVRGKRPVKLVYARKYIYYKNALRGEKQIKRLDRKKKEELIKTFDKVIF